MIDELPPSKTRRKKAMHEVQSLGVALVAVATEKLATLGLPEQLYDAIVLAKSIKKHEARRRQMQYIGKLMRDIDPEPIRLWLAERERIPDAEKAHMAMLETWRTRLIEEPGALTALHAQFPTLDLVRWQERLTAVRTSRDTPAGKTAYRALFRDLKQLFIPPADAAVTETPEEQ